MPTLIIPDAHSLPGQSLDRFRALGRFAASHKFDPIICLGDWWDLPTLCSHSSKIELEGKRHKRDIEAGLEAMEAFLAPIKKRGGYNPRKVFCFGNHEDRVNTFVAENPGYEGYVGEHEFQLDWEVVPYKQSICIDDIHYSHHFATGVSGRPISGEHIGASLCKKLHVSAVVGHSHIFDHSERTRPDGKKLFGLSAGCYTDPKYDASWCRNTSHLWWRGVVVIEPDGRGYYHELRKVTQRKILRDFK